MTPICEKLGKYNLWKILVFYLTRCRPQEVALVGRRAFAPGVYAMLVRFLDPLPMHERNLFAALGLAAALFAGGAFAGDLDPGTRLDVRIQDLPKPYATRSAANPARIVRPPAAAAPKVPTGFRVNVFAASLADARWLAAAPNGDVFLAEPSAGRVTLLRDANGDGAAELTETFAQGFNQPPGLALRPGALHA